MEILTFLLVVTILIILIVYNSSLNGKIDKLSHEINMLRSVIQKLKDTSFITAIKEAEKPVKEQEHVSAETILKAKTEPTPTVHDKLQEATKVPVLEDKVSTPKVERVQKPKEPKTKTDIEKFVGENLISKIGIIILVLGLGFFVKYAIDKDWIDEYGRTAIGLIAGGILITLAHFMRKSYKTFSSLLTGGGFAVLYLTIAIAFHQYHLFSQVSAFVILLIITVFSVILSLVYDKIELAIFSQFGGYAAPFMVSTGEGNYIVLFTYMLILNAGLLTLAYYKRWHVLNMLAFIFTVIIYSGWLCSTFWNDNNLPVIGAFLFVTLFYFVFFLVNVLNNLKERKQFKGIEIGMILSNNLFYLISGLVILHHFHQGIFKGLFTVLVGLYNFGWVVFLYQKKQIDKNFIFLLIGLVMSYVSLAVPIQLSGHSITLFWTAEFVLLLWLAQLSGIKLLKVGHLLVLMLVIISIIMDWSKLYAYNPQDLPIIINRAFITGLTVLAGMGISVYLLHKEMDTHFIKPLISTKDYKKVLLFLFFTISYVVPFLELQYQMNIHYEKTAFIHTVYGVYNYVYLAMLVFIVRSNKWKVALNGIFYFSLVGLLVYAGYYHVMVLYVRNYYFIEQSATFNNFLFHYLAYPCIIYITWFIFKERKNVMVNNFFSKVILWFIVFFLIFAASSEMDNVLLLVNGASLNSFDNLLEVNHKVGYPILWSICAFILMLTGLRSKNKDYRILSLSLLALIIFKLFIFDVWSMSEGGRITAFIFLGIALLLVSFLYQKLKKLILEDHSNNSDTQKP